MSSELLRKAAASMRERAEKATDGPWKRYGMAGVAAPDWEIVDERRIECDECNEPVALTGCATNDDADHIASWHPAVALAVADWLESVAGALTSPDEDVPHAGRTIAHADEDAANAVARAYLGESA